MHDHEPLEQRLWELHYGLLEEPEAEELRARMAADPAVARIFERVRQKGELVSQAARVETSPLHLTGRHSATVTRDTRLTRTTAFSRQRFRQVVTWAVGAAALLLIGVVGFAAWQPYSPADPARGLALQMQTQNESEASPAPEVPASGGQAEPIEVKVALPRLHPKVSHRFSIQTQQGGRPQAAELSLRLEDPAGNVQAEQQLATDESGYGSFVVPPEVADRATRLSMSQAVDTAAAAEPARFAVPLERASESYVTYLTTDRPWYRRGEVMRFRSVTLTRFGWKFERETQVQYRCTDPSGTSVADFDVAQRTTRGVASGEALLPTSLAPGQYTLMAESQEGIFPTALRHFQIRGDEVAPQNVRVTWDRPKYHAGERAEAKVTVKSPDGKAVPSATLNLKAFVDGRLVPLFAAGKTDGAGQQTVQIQLPEKIEYGDGILQVATGENEPFEDPIPLEVESAIVDLYPEGGDLVAGVKSRVFFDSHDALGKAFSLRGSVVDSDGNSVATIETVHEGRGVFELTPQPDVAYSLRITEPARTSVQFQWPVVRADGVVLDGGEGFVAADQPAVLEMRTSQVPAAPLLVTANCRGAVVGHATIATSEFSDGRAALTLELAPEAAGVVRITVFEGQEPLAERLVYRQPGRQLQIRYAGLQARYAAGSSFTLGLETVDEQGQPQPAVLGVSVVDEAVLWPAEPNRQRMASHFWLWHEIGTPRQFEDANFYVAPTPEARQALNLLLATQGWRRFHRVPASRMAAADSPELNAFAFSEIRRHQLVDSAAKDLAESEQRRGGVRTAESLGSEIEAATPEVVEFSANLGEMPAAEDTSRMAGVEPRAETTPVSAARRVPAWPWQAGLAGSFLLLILAAVVTWLKWSSDWRVPVGAAVVALICLAVSWANQPDTVAVAVATEAMTDDYQADRFDVSAAPEPLTRADRLGDSSESSPTLRAPLPAEKSREMPLGAEMEKSVGEELREGAAPSHRARPADAPADPAPAAPAPQPAIPPSPAPSDPAAAAPAVEVPSLAPPRSQPEAASAGLESGGFNRDPRGTLGGMGGAGGMSSPPGKSGTPKKAEPLHVRERAEAKELGRQLKAAVEEAAPSLQSAGRATRSAITPSRDKDAASQSSQRESGTLFGGGATEAVDRSRKLAESIVIRQHSRLAEPLDKKNVSRSSVTPYWNPLVITDAAGKAEVRFDLPQNVTTYQLQIDGHHEGRLQSQSAQIVVRPD